MSLVFLNKRGSQFAHLCHLHQKGFGSPSYLWDSDSYKTSSNQPDRQLFHPFLL